MPNKTILFVDDSATMRTIMENTFAAEPYDVVTVPSGEAAIAKMRELSPSVVIADAGMAGVNGYDVCKSVREDPGSKGTPVIIVSGVSNPYDESRGREVGATEHVKKPFDTTRLIEKVGELAAASPAAGASAPAPKPAAAAPAPGPVPPAPTPAAVKPQKPAAPSSMGVGAGLGAGKPAHKATMIFGQTPAGQESPRPRPAAASAEVKPIEIEEVAQGEPEPQFQVGTLAELAQMDEAGDKIAPDVAGREIEIDEPGGPAPSPPTTAPVRTMAGAAAAEVASRIDGLTPQQAEAIRVLTAEVVERVVWDMVPDLAEVMIRERLDGLLEE